MTDTNLPPETDEDNSPGIEAPAIAKPKSAKTAKAPKPTPGEVISPKRVRIILEENDSIPPTGQFFGVNGRSYLLRPGEETDVPVEVVECLNDAVEETPRVDANNNVVDYRKRLRFPYRLLGPAN